MDWPHMEKTSKQHNKRGTRLEPTRAKKAGETTPQLEKNKDERVGQHRQDLGRSKENNPEQSEMESNCSGPILHKECRGLSQVNQEMANS